MSTSSSTPAISSDVAELKDMVRALILDRKNQTPASAPVKAVEQSCNLLLLTQLLLPFLELILYTVTNQGRFKSTEEHPTSCFQIQSRNPNPEPNVSPVDTLIPKASIPFPSRRNDERREEKANEQIEKFYEIFKDMNFEISFYDALTLCLNFAQLLKP
ncbi:hypothetical protein Tco_0112022 [Tanacetum coccineum]